MNRSTFWRTVYLTLPLKSGMWQSYMRNLVKTLKTGRSCLAVSLYTVFRIMLFKWNTNEKNMKREIFKGGAKLPPREYRNESIWAFYVYCKNSIVLLTKNKSNLKSQKQCEILMPCFFKLIIHKISNSSFHLCF